MAIESSVMSTGYSPPGRSNGIPKNGNTHSHVEAEEARKPTTSIANGASDTNGVAAPQDLSFDSIEDTIQAFSTNQSTPSYIPSPSLENSKQMPPEQKPAPSSSSSTPPRAKTKATSSAPPRTSPLQKQPS